MRFQAISPNREFEGRTCGVKFENGEALFDDLTIAKKNLGLNAAQVADRMEKDFGYEVIRMQNDGTPLTRDELAALKSGELAPVSVETGVDFQIP